MSFDGHHDEAPFLLAPPLTDFCSCSAWKCCCHFEFLSTLTLNCFFNCFFWCCLKTHKKNRSFLLCISNTCITAWYVVVLLCFYRAFAHDVTELTKFVFIRIFLVKLLKRGDTFYNDLRNDSWKLFFCYCYKEGVGNAEQRRVLRNTYHLQVFICNDVIIIPQ